MTENGHNQGPKFDDLKNTKKNVRLNVYTNCYIHCIANEIVFFKVGIIKTTGNSKIHLRFNYFSHNENCYKKLNTAGIFDMEFNYYVGYISATYKVWTIKC